ncbi:MAG: DUF4349 domain-containing protein [Clostridia bacterium]|nr:DUF4349 domain-containing protein [Clostridia bacterium]
MKQMKKLIALCLVLILGLLFVGCGAESGGDGGMPPAENGGESIVRPDIGRKIVYTVTMTLETEDVTALKAQLSRESDALGGYIQSNSEDYEDGRCTDAYITYRIPTEHLDAFVASVEGNGGVTDKTVQTTDITTSYVDAQAKQSGLLERKALLEQLLTDTSMSTSDRLTVIDEISQVNTELQALQLTINGYDSDVGYSTVSVTLREPSEPWGVLMVVLLLSVWAVAVPVVLIAVIILLWRKLRTERKQTAS